MEGFESWLLRRVAQTVEAGDVPANLLTELQAEFAAARERPQAQSHADAVLDIALELAMPVEEVEAVLGALKAARPRFQRGNELVFNDLCEAVLQWLKHEMKPLKFMRPN
ncbi:MAG: hypothetical protein ABSD47_20630 [Candidatus Methylomirabilota bacterium]|jgi:hypothetical protein